ncbi:MAG TPA: TIGR00730 family Rossman fold protein [Acidimicrobiales bacterium]|jgi:hypothetical protein|nr:TIGR00730 family Rossman fold protein [Acidimicrobiales bacterium]
MAAFESVSVFCGSSPGTEPTFAAAARQLGSILAAQGIRLVYGGASVGLMGVVADAVLARGGHVSGVITESLSDHEIAHSGLDELFVVRTMHERKARMAELSDAVIMLPGGFGTYEEFTESVTWVQLGIHLKPHGILNVDGFFHGLLQFLSHATEMGFIRPAQLQGLHVSDDPNALLEAMAGL